MRRFSRHSFLLVPGAITMAFVLGAAPVSAVTWIKTTLADTSGVALQDAAYQGHNQAVVWQESGPITKVITSTNDGASFGVTQIVEPGEETRQASAAICGTDLYVAFAVNDSSPSEPNLWLIAIDGDHLSGENYFYSAAYQGQESIGRYPDVACSSTYLWVTWEQRVGSQWHVYVNHAPRSFASFDSDPIDLGLIGSNAGHPVIAAVGGRVSVAWPTPSGTIRIHRWSDGPPSEITSLGERQLGAGNPDGGGAGVPRIAARGHKLAVVWYDCGDIRARVSNDRGDTWGPVRTIFSGACGSEFGGLPNSVAIDGSRVLVAYQWFQGFNQKQRRISTTSDFASMTDHLAYAASDDLLLGFAHPSGASKLTGAVDEGSRLRALRAP